MPATPATPVDLAFPEPAERVDPGALVDALFAAPAPGTSRQPPRPAPDVERQNGSEAPAAPASAPRAERPAGDTPAFPEPARVAEAAV